MLKSSLVEIKKILTIRTDRFGEFILTLPAIYALKEKFPKAKVSLFANPYSAQLVKNISDIDEIIEYDDTKYRGLEGFLKLVSEIKKRKFDIVVIFNPKKNFNIISFLAGVPIRVGYDRKWGVLLNRRIEDLKYQGTKHEVEYNFDLLKAIGLESKARVFSITFDKLDIDYVEKILSANKINLSSLVAVHPWTSNPIKQWPLANFKILAGKLVTELNQQVVIIGGKEEEQVAEQFLNACDKSIVNLTGKLSLRQLAALFSKVKFLISNDSGPVHLAAAVNCRVLAIFQSGIPARSSRRWGPYGKNHIVIENDRLEDISVQEVLGKVKQLIKVG